MGFSGKYARGGLQLVFMTVRKWMLVMKPLEGKSKLAGPYRANSGPDLPRAGSASFLEKDVAKAGYYLCLAKATRPAVYAAATATGVGARPSRASTLSRTV